MGKAGSVAWDGFLTGLQFWEAEDPRDFGQRFGGDLMLAASAAAPYAKVPVYRVFGGSSRVGGRYWSPINPRWLPKYRYYAGLPADNTGAWMIYGTTNWWSIKGIGRAVAIGENPGGYIELLIPNAHDVVKMRYFTYLEPPL